jgi:O-methyltransferase
MPTVHRLDEYGRSEMTGRIHSESRISEPSHFLRTQLYFALLFREYSRKGDRPNPVKVRLIARAGRRAMKPLKSLIKPFVPEPVLYRLRSKRNYGTRLNAMCLRAGGHPNPAPLLQGKYVEALTYLMEQGVPISELGDYLEFGVFCGNTLISAHRAIDQVGARHMRLFGFDSFEGLPPEAAVDDGGFWKPGEFSMDYREARRYLTEQGIDWKRTTLVRGWFKDTLNDACVKKYAIKKVGMVLFDCDIYTSAQTALAFCAPLIRDHAVVFFDDWFVADFAERQLGEKKAFDEFLAEHPEFTASDFGDYGNYSKVFAVSRLH